ncbi:MAG: hypothetical protein OFPII_05540 [Osedax symbiont Rs1]|nr:MAG: hypothetical protein OFPII_05540 [Osedax symbiont Rs1]
MPWIALKVIDHTRDALCGKTNPLKIFSPQRAQRRCAAQRKNKTLAD